MVSRNKKGDCGGYVYIHIRLDTNVVFYVGVGEAYYHQRASSKSSRSKFWWNVVNKHGYRIEIIKDKMTRSEARELEKQLIAKYKRSIDGGTLVNFTLGGDGCAGLSGTLSPNFGKKHTPERIENMRKAALNPSKEVRLKLSLSAKERYEKGHRDVLLANVVRGEKHHNYGKHLSADTKAKLSAANSGKRISDEHKKNISKATKGKTRTPETIERIREGAKRRWANASR